MALGCSGLEISDLDIVEGLRNAQLAGRMQLIGREPTIVLDVAHNPHSAHYLVEQLKQRYPQQTIHLVLGMLHDKDIASTVMELNPVVTHWYPASLSGPRAATAEQLCQYLPVGNIQYANPVAAFEAALTQASAQDVIVVAGSFHTVGEVLEHWQKRGE